MIINHNKKTIEMTASEANAASRYNSDKYNELISIKRDFPTFSIVTVKSKSKRSDSLKGLTFSYMENYIAKNGTDEQAEIFKSFRSPEDNLEHKKHSYGSIKKWFLAQFPEIAEYNKKLDRILNGESA